jgi:hypothetical protein
MSQPPVPGEAPKDAASSSDDHEDDDASRSGPRNLRLGIQKFKRSKKLVL